MAMFHFLRVPPSEPDSGILFHFESDQLVIYRIYIFVFGYFEFGFSILFYNIVYNDNWTQHAYLNQYNTPEI